MHRAGLAFVIAPLVALGVAAQASAAVKPVKPPHVVRVPHEAKARGVEIKARERKVRVHGAAVRVARSHRHRVRHRLVLPRLAHGSTRLAIIRHGTRRVPYRWHGERCVLPVLAIRHGWVRVRVPQRPNETTGWLPARDVRFTTTPYEIVIDLASRRFSLYHRGRRAFTAPVGVGKPIDPTPSGRFFVAFRESPPGPGYGPFVLVTSAHSRAIGDWDGSGDAVIAIHGPLGADARIGRDGANISHGCIRLHLDTLLRLRHVPPGTPIRIIKGLPALGFRPWRPPRRRQERPRRLTPRR